MMSMFRRTIRLLQQEAERKVSGPERQSSLARAFGQMIFFLSHSLNWSRPAACFSLLKRVVRCTKAQASHEQVCTPLPQSVAQKLRSYIFHFSLSATQASAHRCKAVACQRHMAAMWKMICFVPLLLAVQAQGVPGEDPLAQCWMT